MVIRGYWWFLVVKDGYWWLRGFFVDDGGLRGGYEWFCAGYEWL